MSSSCLKLHVWSFGFALGIFWGVSLLLTGWLAMLTGWGENFVAAMKTLYVGYDINFWGSVIGGIWGFVDMFITGVILAWLYNVVIPKNRDADAS